MAAKRQLRALIPPRESLRGREVEPLVLRSADAADAICQAAERLGLETICLGTHGRSGATKALLGSVAQSVVANTRRPVLLVRAAPVE